MMNCHVSWETRLNLGQYQEAELLQSHPPPAGAGIVFERRETKIKLRPPL
jgi:hypothetical protein